MGRLVTTGGTLITLTLLSAAWLGRIVGADARLQAAAFERAYALAAVAVDTARREQVLWLHTEGLLLRAARRAAAGDTRPALRLTAVARREAVLARNQGRLEAARYALDLHRDALDATTIEALERAFRAHDGRAALALARRHGLVDAH